jgi:metal-responsive CopG/Arc/MetJ family transcriptional regulator
MAKVMISLPDDLLRRLDAEARRRSMTRSGLLAATIRQALARRDVDSVRKAVERSRERFAGENAFEAAELVRADRDDRRW